MTRDVPRTTDLLDLTRDALQAMLVEWGQPGYRAEQIWNWLYVNLAANTHEMINLPISYGTAILRKRQDDGRPPR